LKAGVQPAAFIAQYSCPIGVSGDVNADGQLTLTDIISLVNSVFKGGPPPNPCEAAGDVNCNGVLSSSDIICMVNFILRSGPLPCDVCGTIQSIGRVSMFPPVQAEIHSWRKYIRNMSTCRDPGPQSYPGIPPYGYSRPIVRAKGMASRMCLSPQIQATVRSRPSPKPECGTEPKRRRSRYHS